jgi:hypothetical protein
MDHEGRTPHDKLDQYKQALDQYINTISIRSSLADSLIAAMSGRHPVAKPRHAGLLMYTAYHNNGPAPPKVALALALLHAPAKLQPGMPTQPADRCRTAPHIAARWAMAALAAGPT